MDLFEQASRCGAADVTSLLEQAGRPAEAGERRDDAAEVIVDLRRRVVGALGQVMSLTERLEAADGQAIALEREAVLALAAGDEDLGRALLDRKVQVVRSRDVLIDQLQGARRLTRELTGRMRSAQERVLTRRTSRCQRVAGPSGPLAVEVEVVVES
jgi:phage shock protein A